MSVVSIPTPQIGHFTSDDYEHIYEPAEDSFILLDALESEAVTLRDQQPNLCVEIGSGSGIVTAFVGSLLAPLGAALFTTDINLKACQGTLSTAQANNVGIEAIRCSLLQPLVSRLKNQVDILIFNPPYVPTDHEELVATQTAQSIGGAWAGGKTGMFITNQVLDIAPTLLSSNGRFYLVAIEQNQPEKLLGAMSPHLQGRIVMRRRAGRELLYVLCFQRTGTCTT